MRVLWTATALESGRFSAVERCTDPADLTEHFNALRSGGLGYLEVRLKGSEFPLLTLGLQGDHAVIHLLDDADRSYLLSGDGSAAPDSVVEVPITDDLAVFSGDFVLTADRAGALLHDFIQVGSPGELGEWREL